MNETRVTANGTANPQRASRSWSAALLLALFSTPASVAVAANQIIVSGASQAIGAGGPKSNVFMGPHLWFTHPPHERLAVIPDAGTVSALRVVLRDTTTGLPVSPGGGNSYTFTIRKDTGGGPVATTLTCLINNANTSCADTTHSFTVNAGDKLDILSTPLGGPNTAWGFWTTRFVSSNPRNTILLGGSRIDGALPDLLSYTPLHGLWTSATEFNMRTVFPASGTLKNLYVDLPTAPGAGASRTFTVYKNGTVATALTCTIANLATSCSDTNPLHTVSVLARDKVVLYNTSTGSPAPVARSNTGIVFEPALDNSFLIAMGTETLGNPTATAYGYVTGVQNLQPDEFKRNQLGQAMTIKSMIVEINPAPDNGAGVNGYQFTLRSSGAGTALLCSITESAKTCSANVDVAITDDDLLSLEVTPSNTPTAYTAFHATLCAGVPGTCPTIQAATAVELLSFTAVGRDGAVDLEWATGSEIDNLGFHLYRSLSEAGPFERITASLIPGLGSSPEGARYGYRDVGRENGVTYYYQLEDVETTGKTKRHGPVSALPRAGAAPPPGAGPAPTPGPGTAPAPGPADGDPGEGVSSWIRYGDPEATSLRVVERGVGHVELELLTGGFWALPEEDGGVRLQVPGFEETQQPGAPALPVMRPWVEAVAGRKVKLVSVIGGDVVAFEGLRPVVTGEPELWQAEDGTLHAGERRKRPGRAFQAAGLYPEEAAQLLGVAFQGDVKKAQFGLSPLRWDRSGGRLLLARRLSLRVEFAGRERDEVARGGSRGRKERGKTTRPAQGVVARLAVEAPGLYGVSYEEVFGSRGRGVAASDLSLEHQGEAVAFHVEPPPERRPEPSVSLGSVSLRRRPSNADPGERRFGPGGMLYFVSSGAALNPYGKRAVYELSVKAGGVQMSVKSAAPSGDAVVPYYWPRVEQEVDSIYQGSLLTAPERWFWDYVMSGQTKSYTFPVSALAESSEPSRLSVWLQGASDFPADPDHHVRVSVNGTAVGEASWDGKHPSRIEAEVPPGVLHEGENTLALENVGDTGAPSSMVLLDRYSLSHPRGLVASGGALAGRIGPWGTGTAVVQGLVSAAFVVDTTPPGGSWLRGALSGTAGLSFRAEPDHSYLAVSAEAVLRPGVSRASPSALREGTNRAEYLVLGPRAFLEAAAPLLEHRRAQGLETRGVPIEEVFDEFGFGEPRPEAVRDFLSHAYHHWALPPRYVLLLGDASYDFKDAKHTGVENQVPPYLIEDSYMWTVSDPAYASVNGEDLLPDLAVGRLPAQSVEQARALVEKVLAWENAGFDLSGRAVLVADNPDSAGDFEGDAESLAQTFLAGRETQRIYLSQLGGATRSSIYEAFDTGSSLMSYMGHGAIALWASENVFNFGDVANLAPQAQQPFLMTINCLNGYFHYPFLNSLAEELVKAEGKGAIGAFAPSSLSVNWAARLYHEALVAEIASGRHERLGDALLAAQSAYADTGARPELLRIYQLLADPALRIR